jgi:hypothetical protein
VGSSCTASSTAPVTCPQGQFCEANSTVPKPCASGFYCPTSAIQLPCTVGNFCPQGSSAVTPCPSPSTTYVVGTESYMDCMCPKGYFGRVSSSVLAACTICPVGQFCPAVNSKCSC